MNRLNRRKERLLNEIAERVAQKLIRENDDYNLDDLLGPDTGTSKYVDVEKEIENWSRRKFNMDAEELAQKIVRYFGGEERLDSIHNMLKDYQERRVSKDDFLEFMEYVMQYNEQWDSREWEDQQSFADAPTEYDM